MNLTDEAIRKAAILVSALDAAAADALLDSMDDALAARVRATYMELDDVDIAEQRRVIEQFMGKEKQPATAEAAIDELDLSLATPLEEYLQPQTAPATVSQATYSPASGETGGFDFLTSATGDELAAALRDEHPQTIAVVLAHIAPATAAAALARLSPTLQREVAQRIVDLKSVDAEALGELRASLQQKFRQRLSTPAEQCSGLEALKRIWQQASASERATLRCHLRDCDARLLMDDVGAADATPEAKHPSPATDLCAKPTPSTKLRHSREPSVTIPFGSLAELDGDTLRCVLRRVESRTLLLALAGASTTLIDRVYGQLPRREAQSLRWQIEQQGPLSLRDVAEAQRRIAALAVKMACDGEIEIPGIRRWELAA